MRLVALDLLDSMRNSEDRGGPSPAEGFRLLKAFFTLRNASIRTVLIELVEKIAAEKRL
jgi:hypothetical protein